MQLRADNLDDGSHDHPRLEVAMKAYLATTGTIFGLLAATHIWRIIAEWNPLAKDTWGLAGFVALGIVAAALSIWAWGLLIKQSRHG
jgi:hypothetical protein